jgi:hypothetical protein
MTGAELAEKLIEIKRVKGWSWTFICGQIGRYVADFDP